MISSREDWRTGSIRYTRRLICYKDDGRSCHRQKVHLVRAVLQENFAPCTPFTGDPGSTARVRTPIPTSACVFCLEIFAIDLVLLL